MPRFLPVGRPALRRKLYCSPGGRRGALPPGPPAPPGPPGPRGGRNSSGVNLPSLLRSSFFNAMEALAISFSSIVPSLLASSVCMSGGTKRGPPPGPPGPPCPPAPPGPPGWPSRGGRFGASCAKVIAAANTQQPITVCSFISRSMTGKAGQRLRVIRRTDRRSQTACANRHARFPARVACA